MRSISLEVVGDMSYCVPDLAIDQVIEEVTSEHDGEMHVLIVCGPFTDNVGKKLVLVEGDKCMLVVFQRHFIALFDEDCVNVKELIQIMDCPRVSLAEFVQSIHLDVCDK